MNDVENKLYRLSCDRQALVEFLGALGFEMVYMPGVTDTTRAFRYKKMHTCSFCGAKPWIVKDYYDPGRWLAQCPKCATRTVSVESPLDAIRGWNRELFTEETILTRHKLTKDFLDDVGAVNLLEALKRSAVRDLMSAEMHGGLDSAMAKQAAWFINNQKVVDDIVSGERRRREEEMEKERGEDDLR